MEIVPFLLFILCCIAIVGAIWGLFYLLTRFGRGESYDLRSVRCPQCNTQRKPRKTGKFRNLVEAELECPVCGHISWDIPPRTDLSAQANGQNGTQHMIRSKQPSKGLKLTL